MIETNKNLTFIFFTKRKKRVDEETYKVYNMCCLRIQLKEDWRQKDSEETCLYRNIINIMVTNLCIKEEINSFSYYLQFFI